MFEYIVHWYDCNRAEEGESGIQYRGFDRTEALAAKKYCDIHCCGGGIDIRLLWKSESRGERLDRLAEEEIEEYENGAVWYRFADGTEGCFIPYDEDSYYVSRFADYHGEPVNLSWGKYKESQDIKYIVDALDAKLV